MRPAWRRSSVRYALPWRAVACTVTPTKVSARTAIRTRSADTDDDSLLSTSTIAMMLGFLPLIKGAVMAAIYASHAGEHRHPAE